MQHTVFIVGTDHGFQTGSPRFTHEAHLAFSAFIEQAVKLRGALALCEENSSEALAEQSLSESVPFAIARRLGIAHQYCDPNLQQRADLGIQQENAIRVRNWRRQLSEEEVARYLDESNKLREVYWIQKLKSQDVWPALFICGATHVESLLQVAAKNEVNAVLLAADWEA